MDLENSSPYIYYENFYYKNLIIEILHFNILFSYQSNDTAIEILRKIHEPPFESNTCP